MTQLNVTRAYSHSRAVRIWRQVLWMLILFLFSASAGAQVPNWDWAVTAGGDSGGDTGYGIAVNSNGDVYVAGYQESATFAKGTGQETALSVAGGFIAKYDTDGVLLWVKPIDGGVVAGVALDADENPVIAGYFMGTVIFGPGESSTASFSAQPYNQDRFLAKYNDNGVLQWANKLGKFFSYDQITDITSDSRDYITVTGMSYESPSDMYSFVEQRNAFGTYIWAESACTYTAAVTSDTLNNSYTAGVSGKMNVQHMVIARYSDTGVKSWQKSTSGTGSIQVALPRSIEVDGSGHIYVSGTFLGSITFGPGESNETMLTVSGYTPFLAKYTNSGSLIWVHQTQGEEIALDHSGFLYAASYTVLQKFDLDGNCLWTKTDAASAGGTVQDIAVGTDNVPYLTGTYNTSVTFDPGSSSALTLNAEGYQDIFVAKLASIKPTVSGVVFFYPSYTMIQGAVITFSGLGTTTTNAGGFYTMEVPFGWSGTVTPSVTGLDFQGLSYTLTNVVSDVLYQDFYIIGDPELPIAGHVYSDNGTVPLAGASVTASGGAGTVVSDGTGYYELTVPYSWTGTVTPSHTTYAFTPASRSYTSIVCGYLDQDYAVPGTDVSGGTSQPETMMLYANYPNPFNHSTVIRYEISTSREIRLDIFSAAGRLVRSLYHGRQGAGSYEITWNGVDDAGHMLASGMYFCRLTVSERVLQRKMLFIK